MKTQLKRNFIAGDESQFYHQSIQGNCFHIFERSLCNKLVIKLQLYLNNLQMLSENVTRELKALDPRQSERFD